MGITSSWKGCGEIGGHYLYEVKAGARKRGMKLSVSNEYLWGLYVSQGGVCALTGEPIVFGRASRRKEQTASLDRIDSSLGYVEGNLQWVHKVVNRMKWDMVEKAFVTWCVKVTDYSMAPLSPSSHDCVHELSPPADCRVTEMARDPGARPCDIMTREFLGKHYVVLGKGIDQIAKEVGVRSATSVRKALLRHGIKPRPKSYRNAVALKQLARSKWRGHGEISGAYLCSLRYSSKARDLPFLVTPGYIWDVYLRQRRLCSMSGEPINFSKTSKDRTRQTASLERINSDRGYEPGNVQWVHKTLQRIKLNMPTDRFLAVCRRVALYKGKMC